MTSEQTAPSVESAESGGSGKSAESAESAKSVGGGLFTPLRDRIFAWYFAGQVVSQIGDGIFLVALPFLILGDGGPARLGVVLACHGIARLVMMPVGGTFADRWSARVVMIGSDAARAVVMLGYALAAWVGHVPLWAYILIAVPFGALDGMFLPASYSVLPSLVSRESLGAANSLVETMSSTAQVAGPAVGGALVGGFKAGAGMVADAVSFAASSAMLLFAVGRRGSGQGADVGDEGAENADAAGSQDAGDGIGPGWLPVLRYTRHSPLLRMALLVTVVVNLAYDGTMEVALPAFSSGPLSRGAGGFGALMTGFGLGSVVGALGAARFQRLRHRAKWALVLGMAQGALVACVPLGSSIVVAVVALAAAAALQAVLNVFYVTMLQRAVPEGALGRVMSLVMGGVYLSYPLSTLVFGAVVGSTGPGVLIVVGGLSIGLAFLIGFTSRVYRNL